jgi:hypothetical protein
MDEVNETIAGREVLEVHWSRDANRMRVVVWHVDEGVGRELNLLFERVGGVYKRRVAR